ncbi:unnamed protein product [Brassica rapa]|uniref:Uncharacterized protein n=1 Tax=Brassica campestris TaxID=3711 RepID=A0A3P6B2V1_BRACM|nr:unnamed protein product [Brassica rapa]VDC95339.1 unnamed protein product [Brassica rapa]
MSLLKKTKDHVLFQIEDSGNTEENYPSFRSYKGTQRVKDGLSLEVDQSFPERDLSNVPRLDNRLEFSTSCWSDHKIF